MIVKCPICGKDGSMQQRNKNVRIGHYKGYKKQPNGKTTVIVDWHMSSMEAVLVVNKGKVTVNNEGKLTLFTQNEKNEHCLPSSRKIMSLAPWPG